MKKILITGATGFVGKKLTVELLKKNAQIYAVTRDPQKAQKSSMLPVNWISWEELNAPESALKLEGIDTIFHLAGESISQRWTPEVKKALWDSRINSTRKILELISTLKQKPNNLISASAIGYYGDRDNELLAEDSAPADKMISKLCVEWENEAKKAEAYDCNVSLMRIGIVLGDDSGALSKMRTPFALGAGGKISTGKQWMSWIHIDDLVQSLIFCANNSLHGAINATAPEPVTNTEFTKLLSDSLGVPAIFPVPEIALKTLFGEMSQIVLASQNVSSKKLQDAGFNFKFATLDKALKDLLEFRDIKGTRRLRQWQWIKKDKSKVFSFFSDASNLEKLTPPWLNFKIDAMNTAEINKDTIINYSLVVRAIPIKWETQITDWQPGEHFTDNQNKGPYKLWHHTHRFHEVLGGTLMEDEVIYKVPFSVFGEIAAAVWVENDVKKIFNYRKEQIHNNIEF